MVNAGVRLLHGAGTLDDVEPLTVTLAQTLGALAHRLMDSKALPWVCGGFTVVGLLLLAFGEDADGRFAGAVERAVLRRGLPRRLRAHPAAS